MPSLAVRYGTGQIWIDVPSRKVLGVLCYRPFVPPPRQAAPVVEQALEFPVDGPSFADWSAPGGRVCVVVPERGSAAASDVVLPIVLDRLAAVGVASDHVDVLVANGLRRPMGDVELDTLLGTGVRARVRVVQNDPRDAGAFAEAGRTRGGVRVLLHRRLLEADRIVMTGAVSFHPLLGVEGGMTAVATGCCAAETVDGLYRLALDPAAPDYRVKGVGQGLREGNPLHEAVREATALPRKPVFLIDTIVTPDGRLLDAAAGTPEPAFAEGRRILEEQFAPPCEKQAALAVAVAGGFPKDVDFLQTWRAIENCVPVVEEGGVLVMAAECREGWGAAEILAGFDGADVAAQATRMARRFSIHGWVALATRLLAKRCRIVFVSSLPADEVRRAGMEPAATPEAAAELIGRWLPPDPPTYILPEAGFVAPRLQ